MTRRIHVSNLQVGELPLDPAQTHHARDVLRLENGSHVQVFDDAGATAGGTLVHLDIHRSAVRIDKVNAPSPSAVQCTVAAAVPKGERADWMIEKLSELGVSRFIPLAAARSVVLPEGKGKRERWMRVATEAAKQSRRSGVMQIDELTRLHVAISGATDLPPSQSTTGEVENEPAIVRSRAAWFFTTEVPSVTAHRAIMHASHVQALTLFIGPEGGWTLAETAAFATANVLAVSLGPTILRIETAAVAAAAIVAAFLIAANTSAPSSDVDA